MTFPTTFANLAAGNQPASLLDTMFNLVGAQGAIPTTASGTNAITLTPITNYYLPAAYANFQIVSFVAANSSTGSVTIRLGALAFVNLYMPSGLQAGSGDITANNFYIAAFNGALNSGSGGFQVFNASTPSVIQPVQGDFKNLKITNGGTPDTQCAVTADQVMLQNNAGGTAKVSTVAVTIGTGSVGANGLDSGTIASATWYAVYVIYNGSTTAGLMSTNFTTPTLPATYTYFARVGAMTTAPAATSLYRSLQFGRRAQYLIGTNPTIVPNIANGSAGTFSGTSPTLTNVSISAFVPPTASLIRVMGTDQYKNGTLASILVAPNTSWGGTNNGPTGSNGQIYPIYVGLASGAGTISTIADITLESTNIAWASSNNGGAISCLGWEDNI